MRIARRERGRERGSSGGRQTRREGGREREEFITGPVWSDSKICGSVAASSICA